MTVKGYKVVLNLQDDTVTLARMDEDGTGQSVTLELKQVRAARFDKHQFVEMTLLREGLAMPSKFVDLVADLAD